MSSEVLVRRIVKAAREDRILARKLLEIAGLEASMMRALGFREIERGIQVGLIGEARPEQAESLMPQAIKLCLEVAAAVAQPGEDAEEIGQWLSDNIQPVVKALPRKRWWWPFGW